MYKVLVVDDSVFIRQVMTQMLGEDPDLEVCGVAKDAYEARDKIKALRPDVLTLDIEMPGMNGLVFLRNLMRLHPMPVVMCSSLTSKNADVTLAALELGAFDFIHKPDSTRVAGLDEYADEICAKVRAAAASRQEGGGGERVMARPVARAGSADAILPPPKASGASGPPVIAIGASTGGTEALRRLFGQLAPDLPPILITQHIPEAFSEAFAARLDRAGALSVRQAATGDRLEGGHAYVAPGGIHMMLQGDEIVLNEGPKVNRHRPSVDVLFRSVAASRGAASIGVLLTGMGDDGARGLGEIRELGGRTAAQDEESCVVFGMPREAIELGAAESVLGLSEVSKWLSRMSANLTANA